MRTKSEVLEERRHAVMGGCCDRWADMKGCDCLSEAVDDVPKVPEPPIAANDLPANPAPGDYSLPANPAMGGTGHE